MAAVNFGFQIVNVDIVYKAMAPRPSDLEGDLFSFDVSVESSVHKDNQLVFVFVKSNLRDADRIHVLATFTTACIFQIFDFKEKVRLNKDGLYEIDEALENALKNFSIGTTRGIIWSELRGSYLHNVILPVIDISTLAKNNDRQILDDKGNLINTQIDLP